MPVVGWLVVFDYVDLAIFQPYLDLEAGDNQSLKIQVAKRGKNTSSSKNFDIFVHFVIGKSHNIAQMRKLSYYT